MTAATAAPTHRGQRRTAGPLTGLRSLLRLHLRLARRGILIWTLAVLVLVPASIYAMEDVYPDQAALDARAALLDNPSAVMMTGPFFAADHYTFWAMVANELLLYLLVPAAIMSILLTARLTRGEEESGRLELLRSLPTGRLAPSVSALIVVALANLAVGAAVTAGMLIGGGATADSLALGLATALTGLVFGAVTAVTAQLTEHAGTASGTALGILALAFMIRGIGDVIERDGSWLSWFSPLAWAQQTRAFVDLRWWPLLLPLAATAALLAPFDCEVVGVGPGVEGFAAGDRVRYVKPHGALYNAIVHDEAQARIVAEAVKAVDPTLTFLGAARTVTGSKYLVTKGDRRVLVDAGMFGSRSSTEEPFEREGKGSADGSLRQSSATQAEAPDRVVRG